MAINLKFDLAGNPEPPTIILANRNGNKLGQLKVDTKSIEVIDRLNDASEFSFVINKYVNGKLVNLWDKVVDFKLVYCKEWDCWFEIQVDLDEETETTKTVLCTQLGYAELSQIILHGIEINTEKDIERDDYKIAILYDEKDIEASILGRLLKDKAPHYSIAYVSPTISNIQRTFSFDGTSIADALQSIAEEIGCIFRFDAFIDEDGLLKRRIYAYDLQQYCNDCGHRGEYTGNCPKCNGDTIINGYGEDTLIFVTSDELASGGIQLTTDVGAVKNCFKLEAGDDLMTSTVRNCNPNGTDYIWYFSDSMKEDMSSELVEKLNSYDEKYRQYYNEHISDIDSELIYKYNNLIDKYYVYNEYLQKIQSPIVGYSPLMNALYNTIDFELYLRSGLMPSIEMSDTSAKEQLDMINALSIPSVAVADVSKVSLSTANNAVLGMAKTIVRPTYQVKIASSELVYGENSMSWYGNFVVTNYSDEEDTATGDAVTISINDDMESFVNQKLNKILNNGNTDDFSISKLFAKEYEEFCEELKKYALNPLNAFYDSCQACIDILIDQGIGNENSWSDNEEGSEANLYEKIYLPYYDKLIAIESEIKIRDEEISVVSGVYDADGNLISEGLKSNIESHRNQIQSDLDFEKHLGKKLWLEFCAYRREDVYSNENYISDGLDNAELFKRASDFFDIAENEIYKSAELQHSISTTLKNLFAIDKFKSLIKYFKLGNWIRVSVDDKIFKLRLIEYDVSFDSLDSIPVEFSNLTKIKNGTTDVQDIFSQASSMATSYSSVKRQANQGNLAKDTVEQWMSEGLNSAVVQIQNNNNEDIVMTKNGLICRSYDDITESYLPEQLKITHNVIAYTDNDWKTARQAIGKHTYIHYDKSNDKFADEHGYGMNADFVTAGIVSGSQIIGGDIYSNNYSNYGKSGSHLNLTDGTFSFAGGRLTYDGDHLAIDGKITIATSGTIGCWEIDNFSIYKGSKIFGNPNGMYFGVDGLSLGDKFKVTPSGVATLTGVNIEGTVKGEVFATSGEIGGCSISNGALKIKAENIAGRLNAEQIDTSGLIAENISSEIIADKSITGGSINCDNISGILSAKNGSTIGSWKVDSNSIYSGSWSNAEDRVFMCTGTSSSYTIGGSSQSGWAFGAGSTFGVTKSGGLYSTKGKIGGWDIGESEFSTSNSSINSQGTFIFSPSSNCQVSLTGNTDDGYYFSIGKDVVLKFGQTTLTEPDLIKLLALI